MPMFNVEEYVSAAIDSVKKQTFENWELLIIDDGSTDDSNLIAQKYTQTDHRIKLFCKKILCINYFHKLKKYTNYI